MGVFELLIRRGGVPQVEQFILADRQVGQLPGSTLFNLIFIKSSKCLLLKSLQAAGANGPPCLSGNLVVDFHLLIKTPCKGGGWLTNAWGSFSFFWNSHFAFWKGTFPWDWGIEPWFLFSKIGSRGNLLIKWHWRPSVINCQHKSLQVCLRGYWMEHVEHGFVIKQGYCIPWKINVISHTLLLHLHIQQF